jgi:hypothetical protein
MQNNSIKLLLYETTHRNEKSMMQIAEKNRHQFSSTFTAGFTG